MYTLLLYSRNNKPVAKYQSVKLGIINNENKHQREKNGHPTQSGDLWKVLG